MSEALDILLQASFWAATLRIATPLIFATLGELLCERAGTLNLGIEGIMTLGAMIGWLAVYQGADLWTGVLLAALAFYWYVVLGLNSTTGLIVLSIPTVVLIVGWVRALTRKKA